MKIITTPLNIIWLIVLYIFAISIYAILIFIKIIEWLTEVIFNIIKYVYECFYREINSAYKS